MSEYRPEVGDRVRIVIEGDVRSVDSNGDFYTKDNCFEPGQDTIVSIEKVKPPVEVFKPGDVVRHKRQRFVVALDRSGYTYLSESANNGHRFAYEQGYEPDDFTSEDYERVELG